MFAGHVEALMSLIHVSISDWPQGEFLSFASAGSADWPFSMQPGTPVGYDAVNVASPTHVLSFSQYALDTCLAASVAATPPQASQAQRGRARVRARVMRV